MGSAEMRISAFRAGGFGRLQTSTPRFASSQCRNAHLGVEGQRFWKPSDLDTMFHCIQPAQKCAGLRQASSSILIARSAMSMSVRRLWLQDLGWPGALVVILR